MIAREPGLRCLPLIKAPHFRDGDCLDTVSIVKRIMVQRGKTAHPTTPKPLGETAADRSGGLLLLVERVKVLLVFDQGKGQVQELTCRRTARDFGWFARRP